MTIRQEIFDYVKQEFDTEPEYLWARYPEYAVLRCKANSKWYGVIMNVPAEKLGLNGSDDVDIIDVKCDPQLIGSLVQTSGYLPAYHMNKGSWIGIRLDGSVPMKDVFYLINSSYEMTKPKRKTGKKHADEF